MNYFACFKYKLQNNNLNSICMEIWFDVWHSNTCTNFIIGCNCTHTGNLTAFNVVVTNQSISCHPHAIQLFDLDFPLACVHVLKYFDNTRFARVELFTRCLKKHAVLRYSETYPYVRCSIAIPQTWWIAVIVVSLILDMDE